MTDIQEVLKQMRELVRLVHRPNTDEVAEWADAIEADLTRKQESYVRVLRQREDQNAEIERLKVDVEYLQKLAALAGKEVSHEPE